MLKGNEMNLPIGNDAPRPIKPEEGMLREYVRDNLQYIEIYQNEEWCVLLIFPTNHTETK